MQNKVKILNSTLKEKSIQAILSLLVAEFNKGVVFSTSFGMEDQVITNEIALSQLPISIFTLDTGRLFPETYSTWSHTLQKYGLPIKAYYPNEIALQQFITQEGPNAFYTSIESRKACCHIRKVEPLQRALKNNQIWITGIRADQSNNRQLTEPFEWDAVNQIIKYHPLLNWTFEAVKSYVQHNNVSYNPLHDNGFVSIGCAPCTRAIKEGEDFRAGRWWWEENDKKECGLHVHQLK